MDNVLVFVVSGLVEEDEWVWEIFMWMVMLVIEKLVVVGFVWC